MKTELKEKAILLRRHGLSYSEILKQIPVAKSTLSLWLRSVGLSETQEQRLTQRKRTAMLRGAESVKRIRIKRTAEIKKKAKDETKQLVRDPFWFGGVLLYWAEGVKIKPWRTSEQVSFMNMDINMILLFTRWLKKYCNITPAELRYSIYIHKNGNITKAKKFWSNHLNINEENLRIYLKKHNPKTIRKNTAENYNGTLKITVVRSTDLNRRIAGWIEGVIEYFG